MRGKLQTNKIYGFIAVIGTVLFLTCYLPMQAAGADYFGRAGGRDVLGIMDATGRIETEKSLNSGVFNSYTVTYHPNGGRGKTIEVSVDTNTDYAVIDQGFERELYFFVGWNTKPDGLGKNYFVGQTIHITKDITLYAKWGKRI